MSSRPLRDRLDDVERKIGEHERELRRVNRELKQNKYLLAPSRAHTIDAAVSELVGQACIQATSPPSSGRRMSEDERRERESQGLALLRRGADGEMNLVPEHLHPLLKDDYRRSIPLSPRKRRTRKAKRNTWCHNDFRTPARLVKEGLRNRRTSTTSHIQYLEAAKDFMETVTYMSLDEVAENPHVGFS